MKRRAKLSLAPVDGTEKEQPSGFEPPNGTDEERPSGLEQAGDSDEKQSPGFGAGSVTDGSQSPEVEAATETGDAEPPGFDSATAAGVEREPTHTRYQAATSRSTKDSQGECLTERRRWPRAVRVAGVLAVVAATALSLYLLKRRIS